MAYIFDTYLHTMKTFGSKQGNLFRVLELHEKNETEGRKGIGAGTGYGTDLLSFFFATSSFLI